MERPSCLPRPSSLVEFEFWTLVFPALDSCWGCCLAFFNLSADVLQWAPWSLILCCEQFRNQPVIWEECVCSSGDSPLPVSFLLESLPSISSCIGSLELWSVPDSSAQSDCSFLLEPYPSVWHGTAHRGTVNSESLLVLPFFKSSLFQFMLDFGCSPLSSNTCFYILYRIYHCFWLEG